MSSIIRANASLTAGGLAVVNRSYSNDLEGSLNYSVTYVCLDSFAKTNAALFRIGSAPPTPLPSHLIALDLRSAPGLTALTTRTENGLAYFEARYASSTNSEFVITQSEETKVFAASRVVTSSGTDTTFTLTFDYISRTVRVSATNTYPPGVKGSVGAPFNVVGNTNSVYFRSTTIETKSKTRSSRGNFSFETNSTGIYEATSQYYPLQYTTMTNGI
jgi:hypothetical protein